MDNLPSNKTTILIDFAIVLHTSQKKTKMACVTDFLRKSTTIRDYHNHSTGPDMPRTQAIINQTTSRSENLIIYILKHYLIFKFLTNHKITDSNVIQTILNEQNIR